jgi:hypothetical protein
LVVTPPQLSDAAIIMDASEYIKELKQKVVRIKQETMACEGAAEALVKQSSSQSPTTTVIHSRAHTHTRTHSPSDEDA